MDIESIRQSFRPAKIRLLLVGESPPVSGKFFYEKSAMTTHTAQAFQKAHGINFRHNEEFLNYFKASGCYLDDLSHTPVDNLPKQEREKVLKANVDGLVQRIQEMNPEIVVIALMRIKHHILEAIHRSGQQPKVFVIPFAGFGHQRRYINELCKIIDVCLPATPSERL